MIPSREQKMSLRISDKERQMIEDLANKQNMAMSQVLLTALYYYNDKLKNPDQNITQTQQKQSEQTILSQELRAAEIVYNIEKMKYDTIKIKIETAKLESEYKQLISDSTEDSNDHTRTL